MAITEARRHQRRPATALAQRRLRPARPQTRTCDVRAEFTLGWCVESRYVAASPIARRMGGLELDASVGCRICVAGACVSALNLLQLVREGGLLQAM